MLVRLYVEAVMEDEGARAIAIVLAIVLAAVTFILSFRIDNLENQHYGFCFAQQGSSYYAEQAFPGQNCPAGAMYVNVKN